MVAPLMMYLLEACLKWMRGLRYMPRPRFALLMLNNLKAGPQEASCMKATGIFGCYWEWWWGVPSVTLAYMPFGGHTQSHYGTEWKVSWGAAPGRFEGAIKSYSADSTWLHVATTCDQKLASACPGRKMLERTLPKSFTNHCADSVLLHGQGCKGLPREALCRIWPMLRSIACCMGRPLPAYSA